MKSNAIIITGGLLDTISAKTAHGLIRGTDRFKILGVIDQKNPGKDAGEVLDGIKRGIPVYASLSDFAAQAEKAKYAIVGLATKGGVIPDSLREELREAIQLGYGIINGLHEFVSDIPELVQLAEEKGVEIIDVRKPKKFKDLHFWSGKKIAQVKCPKIAVLGTDCALGKRTTSKFLVDAMRKAGYKAEMVYTGQTGWMQGAKYGFVFDSTLNDFISGEMEHAVYTCYMEEKPDIIFIEGQSSLRNPSGPAGAEWICSAAANAVVLQHNPARKHYKDLEYYPALVAQPEEEIELIRLYGAPTVAVTINTAKMDVAQARAYALEAQEKLNIPVILPLEDGVDALVPLFEELIKKSTVDA